MDINLIADPNLIPRPRPEVRVEHIQATAVSDGKRIHIELQITPFAPADRPNLDIEVIDPLGESAGSVAIVETMHNSLSLTFHLRAEKPLPGNYRVRGNLYYDEGVIQSTAEATLNLPD
jgi:hypothetical protein